jgi:hypothetical protein
MEVTEGAGEDGTRDVTDGKVIEGLSGVIGAVGVVSERTGEVAGVMIIGASTPTVTSPNNPAPAMIQRDLTPVITPARELCIAGRSGFPLGAPMSGSDGSPIAAYPLLKR